MIVGNKRKRFFKSALRMPEMSRLLAFSLACKYSSKQCADQHHNMTLFFDHPAERKTVGEHNFPKDIIRV